MMNVVEDMWNSSDRAFRPFDLIAFSRTIHLVKYECDRQFCKLSLLYIVIPRKGLLDPTCVILFLVVFIQGSNQEEEESLMDESTREGSKFSENFQTKHGSDCNQFVPSSLADAVPILSDILF